MRIDLHAHSTASDGTDPPAEVMRHAVAAGLDVVALTDHDTVAGWAEASAALPSGLTMVPGAELSCGLRGPAGLTSLHLLAYLFDPSAEPLATEREAVRTDRDRRAVVMVDRLRDLGAPVELSRVRQLAAGGAVGRPHVARAMVEAGVVPDIPAAFTDEWIGSGGRAYVEKRCFDPVDAVRLVADAGGVSVVAHPGAPTRGTIGDDVLAELAGAGLTGVEVDHPDHDPPTRARLRGLAGELGLVPTGSSDDHGTLTGRRLGANVTAVESWEALRDRASGVAPVVGG